MYLVARLLSPESIGMASLAISISGLLVVFPPLVMGDVLIARRRHGPVTNSNGGAVAVKFSLVTAGCIAVLALPIASAYRHYPTITLAGLLALIALRPISEAFAVTSITDLRAKFQYRTVALVDGSVQLASTILTVVLAAIGAGAVSMVLPQVTGAMARSACYRFAAGAKYQRPLEEPVKPQSPVVREFMAASVAQYVHNAVFALPLLALGYFAGQSETGFYSFAFMLATQATVVIGAQLVVVLQPVFGHLHEEPDRRDRAFMRVVAMVSAVSVPIALLQAALAGPLFSLLFAPKWNGSLTPFIVLSMSQAFYFGISPTIALLKAQGHFRAFFAWQAVHFVVAAITYSIAASQGGAIAVAVSDLAIWAISAPFAMWLSTRQTHVSALRCVMTFVLPWVTAAPVCALVWLGSDYLAQYGSGGNIVSTFVIGPVGLAVALWAIRITQPETYAELGSLAARAARALSRRVRRQTAERHL
jgi:O-antigen/teichoic acid export membrane protein